MEQNLEVDKIQIVTILSQEAKSDNQLHFLIELLQEYPAKPDEKIMNRFTHK